METEGCDFIMPTSTIVYFIQAFVGAVEIHCQERPLAYMMKYTVYNIAAASDM